MLFSRRHFLQLSGATLCGSLLPSFVSANTQQPLPIPPLFEVKRGQPIYLTMQESSWSFMGGKRASVWGFNGQYLGPTIRVLDGENVKLSCSNRLQDTVGLAIKGVNLPVSLLNNPSRIMRPEASWAPVLPINQSAVTGWYHAFTPGKTARQVYQGLAGMWLIDDRRSNVLLPNQYGINDFPVILQDKHFNFSGLPEYLSSNKDGFLGDTLLTNGVHQPVLAVGKSWIRLRLLNASNSRRYYLSLSNGDPVYLIASDRGILSAPIQVSSLCLAPGERKEILLDMSKVEQSVSLMTGTRTRFAEKFKGFFEPSNILSETKALTLQTTGLPFISQQTLPQQLNSDYHVDYVAQQSREFALQAGGRINGQHWQANRIDAYVKLNSQEKWTITAEFPQAFYIQGAEFQVINVDGKAAAQDDAGWKDTVWVENKVELLVRFRQPSSIQTPFLFYSQNLEQVDAGAMGQFVVS